MTATTSERSELTTEYGVKILFHSFRHSQGNENFQADTLSYVKVLHPSWAMSPILKGKIGTVARPVFERYLFGKKSNQRHVQISKKASQGLDFEKAIEGALNDFEVALSAGTPLERKGFVETLAEGVIRQDRHHLVEKPGRSTSEKWFSFFREYGVLRKATGLDEFDSMYAEIMDYWLTLVDPNKHLHLETHRPKDRTSLTLLVYDIAQVWRRETRTTYFTGEEITNRGKRVKPG